MHNSEQIQVLLDKYWLGDTTLEEERSLKAYFASSPVDERFRSVAPLFQTLRQEQAVQLEHAKVMPMVTRTAVRIRWAAAASIALLLALGAWWLSRSAVPADDFAQTPVVVPPPVTAPPVVAPLPETTIPVVAQSLPVRKHTVKTKKAAPVQMDAETEQAMEEIKAALSLVSAKLNKGKKAALKDLNRLESMDKFLKPKGDS